MLKRILVGMLMGILILVAAAAVTYLLLGEGLRLYCGCTIIILLSFVNLWLIFNDGRKE